MSNDGTFFDPVEVEKQILTKINSGISKGQG